MFAVAKQEYSLAHFNITRKYKLPQRVMVLSCTQEVLSSQLRQVLMNQIEPVRGFLYSLQRMTE
jgi:hypothetical protein